VKPASRTHAIFFPPDSSIRLCTIGISTLARLSLSVRPLLRPSVTSVPAGPLMSVVDSWELLPLSDMPLTLVMTSPRLSPPSLAGEPS